MDPNCLLLRTKHSLLFLQVQQLLRGAKASLVIGSPEAHYSASKVFQCLLSGKPVVAALHQESEAVSILQNCNADAHLATFDPGDPAALEVQLKQALELLFEAATPWSPNLEALSPYHASEGAKVLAEAMETALTS